VGWAGSRFALLSAGAELGREAHAAKPKPTDNANIDPSRKRAERIPQGYPTNRA